MLGHACVWVTAAFTPAAADNAGETNSSENRSDSIVMLKGRIGRLKVALL